jgi:hypothetical protein
MKAAKSRGRVQDPPPDAGTAAPTTGEGLLPPERAFLLQLTDGATPSGGAFAGRLEHLSSGTRLRFTDWDAFRAAVVELLRKHR